MYRIVSKITFLVCKLFCSFLLHWNYLLEICPEFVIQCGFGNGDVIRGKRAHRETVGLTPGNYPSMDALLRAHVRDIYIYSFPAGKKTGGECERGKRQKNITP
jgi:hypothetical protein